MQCATDEELEDIRGVCFEAQEQFMVIFDHEDLRDGVTFDGRLDSFKSSFRIMCMCDQVAYRDTDGNYHEVKVRSHRKGTLKLKLQAV